VDREDSLSLPAQLLYAEPQFLAVLRTLCAHMHCKRCIPAFQGNKESSLECWCREGESNPQGPKPGGF
jgi:hypothetical protein